MSQEPLFSVVIPTRNRADLLRHALQSALEQDFDDYEVLVSNNDSHDHTEELVKGFDDPRLRYVRTEATLPMPDHWEFALGKARGRFVTYLCDDDAWCPALLRRVAEVVGRGEPKVIAMGSGLYYGENWLDPSSRNMLVVEPYSGETRELNSRETLRYIYECGNIYDAPRMLNSFCHRETALRLREQKGRLFNLCPDYSFPAMTLTDIPTWVYIDEPLRLQGIFAEGIGSSQVFNRGEPAQQFDREFKMAEIFKRAPLKIPVVTNYIAETLLTAKEMQRSKLEGIEIDWPKYFVRSWNDLALHERNGVDVAADKEQFFRALSEQPADVQRAVRSAIEPAATVAPAHYATAADARSPLRKSLRKLINNSSVLAGLESLVRGTDARRAATGDGGSFVVRGEEAGFRNILECARMLQKLAGRENATAAHG